MNSAIEESAVAFPCGEDMLIGVVTAPPAPLPFGVVVVVGGPQYRAGSHRQFVALARALAAAGFATLRFDYRGMGDSGGAARAFDTVDDDIRAAIDALIAACPAVRRIALWGLCDGASAAMIYAPTDSRVHALALANPWVRGADTLARTQLKHYYLRRLLAREFWGKVLRGKFRPGRAAAELGAAIAQASEGPQSADYRDTMLAAWQKFDGTVLLLIATADLTAQEFLLFMRANAQRERLLASPRVARIDVTGADHTFSRNEWQAAMQTASIQWLQRQAVR